MRPGDPLFRQKAERPAAGGVGDLGEGIGVGNALRHDHADVGATERERHQRERGLEPDLEALVVEDGATVGAGVPANALEQFDDIVRGGRNTLLDVDGVKVFAEWYGPPPRVLVYGAVDTAEALCSAVKLLGWTAIVADARDILGGDGILLDNHVARHHADMEAIFTFEGTDSVQALIVGRAITGLSAISGRKPG